MKLMKGEFEKQESLFLLFPYRDDVWRENCKYIRDYIIDLANIIARYQKCIIGVKPDLMDIIKTYDLDSNIIVELFDYADIWTRDTLGTIILNDKKKEFCDFNFNAYGGDLYTDYKVDDDLSKKFCQYKKIDYKHYDITLEWGNIITDGNHLVFCVKDSIVNKNRNPGKKIEEIEKVLINALGAKKIIWQSKGLEADETGGHIDNMLSFVNEDTAIISWTDDNQSNDYYRVRELESHLIKEKKKIIKLPIPKSMRRTREETIGLNCKKGTLPRKAGDKILESYVNICYINGAMLVPQFNLKEDEIVISILKENIKDRIIIPIYSRESALGGGGIHCLTKNIF